MTTEYKVIYKVVHGSKAYGLDTPESDTDIKGVCVPNLDHYFGFVSNFEQYETTSPDVVIYKVQKFFKLAAMCNPNLIEMLYVKAEHVLEMSWAGRLLRLNAHAFLSQRIATSMVGYAIGQLKRLERKLDGEAYNYKHAMHCLRLMRMCCEALDTGKVNVFRKDREELLTVRRGEVPLEDIKAEFEHLKAKSDFLIQSTELPKDPDVEYLEFLCRELVSGVLL